MIERISPSEAKDRMDAEGWLYLDVRSTEEFDEGHPVGAYNIPLIHRVLTGNESNPDFLAAIEATFARDSRLIVGCASGSRSLRAARMLEEAGFAHVVDQRAGFRGARGPFGEVTEPGWEALGFPVSVEAVAGRGWRELALSGTSRTRR